jgi:hypothetical protein
LQSRLSSMNTRLGESPAAAPPPDASDDEILRFYSGR